MSCKYCIHYAKLNEECEKGFEVKTSYESFGGSEYEDHEEVRINGDREL